MYRKKKIEVIFQNASAGWIRFQIKVGKSVFNSHFSAVFDPIPDLKHWIEAISLGVQQASFVYNSEGDFIKFNYSETQGELLVLRQFLNKDKNLVVKKKEIFSISSEYSNEVYLETLISRKQLVETIYYGLLQFIEYEKEIAEKWHKHYKESGCSNIYSFKSEIIENYLNNE